MGQVKLSVNLSSSGVAVLGKYAQSASLKSRSTAIQQTIKLPGNPDLKDTYTAAWQEWENIGETGAWAATVTDGVK